MFISDPVFNLLYDKDPDTNPESDPQPCLEGEYWNGIRIRVRLWLLYRTELTDRLSCKYLYVNQIEFLMLVS